MEKEYQISWPKIIGITALIGILIIIICLLYPKRENNDLLIQETYINNMTAMKEAGFEYFQDNKLPKNIGDSSKITLKEMIARNLLIEFLDEEGNTCDETNSYIEVTKDDNYEYSMNVFLSCNNKDDYIVTTINNNVNCTNCNDLNENVNQDLVEENDDKEIVPTYSNSNNSSASNNTGGSNGGSVIINNSNITYVNTCDYNCTTDNCDNNCLTNVYHTVVFEENGGSYVKDQIVKHGSNARYVTTYKEGYEFLGWYLDGIRYDFDEPVVEKIILEAKWQKKDTADENKNFYMVDFDSNGGSYVKSQEVEEGNKAYEPTNPTKDCYVFGGWYLDSSLKIRFDFNTPITQNVTLYAKWIDNGKCHNTYIVDFDSNGGSYVKSQKVEEGNRAYEPVTPVKEGYKFLGWYLNHNEFNFNTRIYENITLVAKWEKIEEKYYTYCKIVDDTYYSTSYIVATNNIWNYDWTIRFDQLKNIDDLKITEIGYVDTLSLYNKVYYDFANKEISKVGGNADYRVPMESGTMLRKYSLKPTNFTMNLTRPYYNGNKWYVDAYVTIYNYQNVTKYYANNLGYYIYYVPFYFDVEYTDLSNCVDDLASKQYKYSNYEIVDTYYD